MKESLARTESYPNAAPNPSLAATSRDKVYLLEIVRDGDIASRTVNVKALSLWIV